MGGASARELALDVLLRVEQGAPSDRALDAALRRVGLDDRERRLATELVYGTLRRLRTIDAELQPHCRRPLERLDPPLRAALRAAVYQCRFLDQVPTHAAVDTAVELVKRRRPPATGFANAVLRSWVRGAGARPSRGRDDVDLATGFDVPDWWARRWQQRYGLGRARRWFAQTLEPAPVVFRPLPAAGPTGDLTAGLAEEGVRVVPCSWATGAFRVVSGNILKTAAWRRGVLSLRGEASQLVAELLAPDPGSDVLEVGSGRGGKTIQLAVEHGARMVAVDRSLWRLRACLEAARAAGVGHVFPVVADLSRDVPLARRYRCVLVDVPCSGLGTVRRRPEIKWRVDPDRLQRLADVQTTILTNVARALEPGGRLLYATCSTEPEENEQVVSAVLEADTELEHRAIGPRDGVDPELIDADGYFRTYPDHPELDGFFAAQVVRRKRR